ncbi:MAG: bifunctional hydroxymethylpyrimidine kinase/phosphomethylpyrimidine kinase [Victivallales bacterium]|nr:bifunctional hydroxymethylpyrimidine kinase/phosphomethylpyrimidine kinase [Victivallales bacterium]
MDLPRALTIAGSDSGGGAGIQADLKTFSAFGVYGASAITSVTVQNTQTVSDVHDIPPEIVAKQIDAVMSDIRIDAVKIGMLSSPEIIRVVAACLRHWAPPFIVLDPVMVSKSGCKLLHDNAIDALRAELLPLATVITPNIPEAEVLASTNITDAASAEAAARTLLAFGPHAVLLKGGHAQSHANDLLATPDSVTWLPAERIPVRNTHGTGCTLSSAITALLAKGTPLPQACRDAKAYVRRAMAANLNIGHGCGPLHHFVDWT